MLGDLLTGPNLIQGGAGAVLTLVVVMILTGRLATRRAVEDVRADRDARLAEARREAEEWRAAHASVVATVGNLTGQMQELLEQGRTMGQFISALRRESAS